MLSYRIIAEGLRILMHCQLRRLHGIKKYPGSVEKICSQIVNDCWNQTYLQTSVGHFREFYARDFGWCTKALLRLGFGQKVCATLKYALSKYQRDGAITVAISPGGIPFNFPNVYSPDSVAYLIRSIRLSEDKNIMHTYKSFLQKQVHHFHKEVIDPKTGIIKQKKHFSSMKDYAIRDASCYDMTMVAMLSNETDLLCLENPLRRYDCNDRLVEYYWNKKFFRDDLSGNDYVSSDANLYPFWFGVVKKKKLRNLALKSIQNAGLDKPFPLKYTNGNANIREVPFNGVVKNWELDCIWPHLGFVYIDIISEFDKKQARKYLDLYSNKIKQLHNFIEVYNPNGTAPYQSLLYHADEGMLWASMYLDLVRRI